MPQAVLDRYHLRHIGDMPHVVLLRYHLRFLGTKRNSFSRWKPPETAKMAQNASLNRFGAPRGPPVASERPPRGLRRRRRARKALRRPRKPPRRPQRPPANPRRHQTSLLTAFRKLPAGPKSARRGSKEASSSSSSSSFSSSSSYPSSSYSSSCSFSPTCSPKAFQSDSGKAWSDSSAKLQPNSWQHWRLRKGRGAAVSRRRRLRCNCLAS